jgi:hypothetical protein
MLRHPLELGTELFKLARRKTRLTTRGANFVRAHLLVSEDVLPDLEDVAGVRDGWRVAFGRGCKVRG